VSGENVELVLRGYKILNRGDVDEFVTEFVHPDYEFHTGVRVPSIPSVVRGRDELRAWIEQWYQDPWEGQLQMDVERIEELDDGACSRSSRYAPGAAGAARRSTRSTRTSSPFATASASGSTAFQAGSAPSRPPAWGTSEISKRGGGMGRATWTR
jgi:hypothetical protein